MAFILSLEVGRYTYSHFTVAEQTHKGRFLVKVTEEVHNRKANSVSLPGTCLVFAPLKHPHSYWSSKYSSPALREVLFAPGVEPHSRSLFIKNK